MDPTIKLTIINKPRQIDQIQEETCEKSPDVVPERYRSLTKSAINKKLESPRSKPQIYRFKENNPYFWSQGENMILPNLCKKP